MTNDTQTLADFLSARIAEDEHLAVTSPDRWGLSHRAAAECKAKRQIIALDDRGYDMEPAMMYLAAIYAAHPDYREEWRIAR